MKQWLVIPLVILGTMIFQNCADRNEAKNLEKIYPPVRIQIAEEKPFEDFLLVSGKAKAIRDVKVVAEESGVMEKILVRKGQFVRKGDTLAVLRNEVVAAQYAQAKAGLNQAEINFRSVETLYQKKAVSEVEYLAARYNLDAAKAAYDLARARYEKLFIKATISGLVNDRFADEGAFVSPMSPVFELLDRSVIKVEAGISERYYDEIKVGTPAEVTFDAFPGLVVQSKISYKSQKVDPVSRTFTVEIEFPNPENRLSSELIANVKILKKAYTNKIIIPQDVVIETEKGFFVFVERNSVAYRIPVEVENIVGNQMVIAGIRPGDHLIVVGHRNIADQDTVRVIQ